LGYAIEFALLLIIVAAHEYAHIAAARHFKLKIDSVALTGLGFRAVIRNLDWLPSNQRALVYLAGPAVNFSLIFTMLIPNLYLFGLLNLGLFIFNMLPVLPLDGGKLLHLFISGKLGNLNASKTMQTIGKVTCALLFIVGLIQVTLYPMNISIICLAYFLARSRELEHVSNIMGFYKKLMIANGKNRTKYEFLPVRCHAVDEDTQVKRMVNLFNENCFNVFYIMRKNEVIFTLNENEFVEKLFDLGYTIAAEYCS
jgi:stage IV sporulation protein FB